MRLDAHQMRAIVDAVEQLSWRFDNYVTARQDANETGYWAGEAKRRQANIKGIEKRMHERGDTTPAARDKRELQGMIDRIPHHKLAAKVGVRQVPGFGAGTRPLPAHQKARGEHVAKVVQQTMRGK